MPGILASFAPVWQLAAGRLYAGPGILDGLLRPPVISFASFFNIIPFYGTVHKVYGPEFLYHNYGQIKTRFFQVAA